MKFGSLFAGIGGFDLGFERAGMKCEWQVEIDPFARRVLERHWLDVRRHDDVRTFPPGDSDRWRVDVICGGFPCQDISNAGKRVGIEGERSGLWTEFARIIRFLRPRYVVVENVSGLLDRGFGAVLGSLASCGYDAEWDCLPASAFGAPHLRDRVFVVGYPERTGLPSRFFSNERRNTELFAARHRSPLGFDYGPAWDGEPELAVLVHGVPGDVDSTVALGNAVVPQVAEWIGRRLMESVAPFRSK
jgi:DNA (cytosine-5)-methyltransferase 1